MGLGDEPERHLEDFKKHGIRGVSMDEAKDRVLDSIINQLREATFSDFPVYPDMKARIKGLNWTRMTKRGFRSRVLDAIVGYRFGSVAPMKSRRRQKID